MSFPLKNPSPNFELFKKILLGKQLPEKVHFVELGVDYEVMVFIAERILNIKTPEGTDRDRKKKEKLFIDGKDVPALLEEDKRFLKFSVEFYHRMGYDYTPVWLPLAPFSVKYRETEDTAILSRGTRTWVEENTGIITSWEDFEAFPWDRINLDLTEYFKFLSGILPDGMKLTFGSTLYEMVGERLMGWQCMFRNLFVDPDLVKAVFEKWGNIVYKGYADAVSHSCVEAIFHCDDMGYKKGTMVRPETLREIVIPWLKKFASLAHEHGKLFLLHSCGNIYRIMDDLIDDVKIDAFHSFQDVIMPVWEFKEKYGDKVGVLGGVDVDKLARYDLESLRKYVRMILDKCMPGGRYFLGSGNTVTNYVPARNYLAMLEEGLRWKPVK